MLILIRSLGHSISGISVHFGALFSLLCAYIFLDTANNTFSVIHISNNVCFRLGFQKGVGVTCSDTN